jgi:hypothetical protein
MDSKTQLKKCMPNPTNESFIFLIAGRRGSGKTTLCIRLLLTGQGGFKNKFDKVILISPTAHLSKQWTSLDTSKWSVYSEYDPAIVKELIEKQSQNSVFRLGQPRQKVLVILDDLGMKARKVKANETDQLDVLSCNGRHLDISVIFMGQVYCQFPTSMRSNADIIISYAMNNLRDMLALYNECGIGNYKDFRDKVKQITQKRYSFLTVRNRGGRIEYYKGFTPIEFVI